MSADMEKVAPGSYEARLRGCLCPQIDNHHGSGIGFDEKGERQFIKRQDCPLHGWATPSTEVKSNE